MAHPNVDLLNKGYDAFDKGDLDTVRALFAEDIVFHVPGRSISSRTERLPRSVHRACAWLPSGRVNSKA